MYKPLILLFSIVIGHPLEAQKIFYDKKEAITADESAMVYFSLSLENVRAYDSASSDHVTVITKYYKSGKIYSVGGYLDEKELFRVGPYQSLYENGANKAKGEYKDNHRFGKWKDWYPNGQLKSIVHFEPPANIKLGPGFMVDSFYDSLGNVLVKDGDGHYKHEEFNGWSEGEVFEGRKDGVWKGYLEGGHLAYDEYYEEGEFVKGKSFYGGDIKTYDQILVMAEPINGYEAFYRWVGSKMRYPKKARKEGVQGKVYVRFIVNRYGDVVGVETIKGISPECNLEAERVIKLSPKWQPCYARGLAVEQKIILPLTFELGW